MGYIKALMQHKANSINLTPKKISIKMILTMLMEMLVLIGQINLLIGIIVQQ